VRTKITTTIEEAMLNKAKALAKQEGLEGTNAIIERHWSCILPVFKVKYGKNRYPVAGLRNWLFKGIRFSMKTSSAEKTWRITDRKNTHNKSWKPKGGRNLEINHHCKQ